MKTSLLFLKSITRKTTTTKKKKETQTMYNQIDKPVFKSIGNNNKRRRTEMQNRQQRD